MFDKAILHLDLDAFFASVECLKNSAFRGKPLIIGGHARRGVVASCSYEARRFGVRTAMPVKMALQLCPDAILLRGDMDRYLYYSRLINDILQDEAPLFERASIDEFYLDLSGMDRYLSCWQWARELRQKVMRESGLPISAALAVNKLVAKVATGEAKPNGQQCIETGREKSFLAPLPVEKLPAVGKSTQAKLRLMGVKKVHTLAQIPPQLLQREFGKRGRQLWEKANGIDHSPIIPWQEQQSLSAAHTFQTDTTHIPELERQLSLMAQRLSFEMRQKNRLCSCVSVKIRYLDFDTYTRQRRIPYTADERQLIRLTRELFHQLYTRRQLIRLVGLKLSGLVQGAPQLQLFEDRARDEQLLQTMDRIRRRFGKKAIRWGY